MTARCMHFIERAPLRSDFKEKASLLEPALLRCMQGSKAF